MQQASHYRQNSMWYNEMKFFCPVSSHSTLPLIIYHALNSSQVALSRARGSPSVLIPELYASNGTISNSGNEKNGPNACDDPTYGEYKNVEAREDEGFARGYDEGLDR
jgi:hypothetical protein